MIDTSFPLYAAIAKHEFERISANAGSAVRSTLLALTPEMGHAECDASKLAGDHPQKRAVVLKLDAARCIAEHGQLIEREMRHFLSRAWVDLSTMLIGWYEVGENLIADIETGYA